MTVYNTYCSTLYPPHPSQKRDLYFACVKYVVLGRQKRYCYNNLPGRIASLFEVIVLHELLIGSWNRRGSIFQNSVLAKVSCGSVSLPINRSGLDIGHRADPWKNLGLERFDCQHTGWLFIYQYAIFLVIIGMALWKAILRMYLCPSILMKIVRF